MDEGIAGVKGKAGGRKESVEMLFKVKEQEAIEGYIAGILGGSGWVEARKREKNEEKFQLTNRDALKGESCILAVLDVSGSRVVEAEKISGPIFSN